MTTGTSLNTIQHQNRERLGSQDRCSWVDLYFAIYADKISSFKVDTIGVITYVTMIAVEPASEAEFEMDAIRLLD